jgi:calcineurin-like phosphoesterase family protein
MTPVRLHHLTEYIEVKNMKKRIWLITDTHLGHDAMVQYCGRPKDHSEIILDNISKLIREGDILIHLGDFCIGKDSEWHEKFFSHLKGVKTILVRGNHDGKSNQWYLEHGWGFVCESFTDTYFGNKVTFSHIPILGVKNLNIHGHFHNTLHRLLRKEFVVEGEKERNDKDFDLDKYDIGIYKLLAIENTDLKPVLLEEFLTPSP